MLTEQDRQKHAALGIDAALLTAARVRRVSDRDARELLTVNGKPGDFSGVEYPYHDPARPHWRWTSRIRLDSPPTDPAGKPSGKYRSPYGDRRHLYFPPGCAEALTDTAIPIVFIEAEKSALALTAAAQPSRPADPGRGARRLLELARPDRHRPRRQRQAR
jgi:hypothetical protein